MKIKTALTSAPIAPLGARLGYTLVCLILYFSGLGNRWGKVRLPRVFHADVERLLLPEVFREGDFQATLYEAEGWFGGRGIVGSFRGERTSTEGKVRFKCYDLWDFNPGSFALQKWKGLMLFIHFLEKWTGLKGLVRQDSEGWVLLDESLLGSLNPTHEFVHEWELEYTPKELEELRNQFLQLLRAGLGEEAQVNLSGADLSGVDLSGAKLQVAYFYEANLRYADLRYADLRYTNLSGADLTGADLTGADLYEANLEGANLTGAKVALADLREATLANANLSGADLTGANLGGAFIYNTALEGAVLTGVNFEREDDLLD